MRLNNKDGIENKTVEIKLLVPGNILFSQEDAASFEAAADAALKACAARLPSTRKKCSRINFEAVS